MANPRSFSELYEIYRAEAENNASTLTDWNEGSVNDILAGATSTAIVEAMGLVVDEFKKTFFDGAEGADLEALAVDHYGADFARPTAQKATATVAFTRPNATAGPVVISSGAIVKTEPNVNGEVQRFTVLSSVQLTNLSVLASVQAVAAGAKGNVGPGEIAVVETALTDGSITVSNAAAASGGAEQQTDAEYRQTIKNLIQQLKGATKPAIEARALTVAGVVNASAIESIQNVVEWNVLESEPVGQYFAIPRVKLYISDVNGNASQPMIDNVKAAISTVRAVGVKIDVLSGISQALNWSASITLNPTGPNYATLSADTTMLIDTMREYLEKLAFGSDFIRADANQAILSIWGPSGTGDLTAFVTSVPSGDVAAAENTKIIAGTLGTL